MKSIKNIAREIFEKDNGKNMFINVLHDHVLMECLVVMTLIFC